MSILRRPGVRALGGVSGLVLLLSGCSSIPASGPTARNIARGVEAEQNKIGMRLVDVDAPLLAQVNAMDATVGARATVLASLAQQSRSDVVGPGDVLSISLYEVGVGLFGGSRTATEVFDPSARSESFPTVLVNREGLIKLPYTGQLDVAGKTVGEIQSMIEAAYRGQSQSPQAIVVLRQNLSETAYITGDIRRPGRIELSLQHERLLDAIALSGGAISPTQDMIVRFSRGGQVLEQRLDRIQAGSADDLTLIAGDRIELIRRPQTYVVFGATGRVAQVPFDQANLTLAEAIARAGGPNDAVANPRGVFLFRYESPEAAGAEPVPTIYRLDLMQPSSYFLSQHFAMRDKDVIYVSNAAINRTAKFVAIINQLFSPFVTARAISGN
jgi:polysaccharide biosynthesis/export protein